MTARLIALLKLARMGVHLVRGLWRVYTRLGRLDAAGRAAQTQAWAQQALGLLGIALRVRGEPPVRGPVLLVANHISWLDILVLLASCPCRFVSKVEVGRWPVIGRLTHAAGTLFIQRESRRDALRVVHQMAACLSPEQSWVLAIFPEGTTSNGLQLLPFHANLFQAAIAANAPVQPVALRFEDAASGQISLAPCYIDDDSLLDSVWRTLCAPPLRVALHFGAPQEAQGRTRQQWALDARQQVEQLRNL
ncbi:MAG: lysophospholipid acyltransferase family protein [Rhodoferax sp.]